MGLVMAEFGQKLEFNLNKVFLKAFSKISDQKSRFGQEQTSIESQQQHDYLKHNATIDKNKSNIKLPHGLNFGKSKFQKYPPPTFQKGPVFVQFADSALVYSRKNELILANILEHNFLTCFRFQQGGNIIIILQFSATMQRRKTRVPTFLLTLRKLLNEQPCQSVAWNGVQDSFKIKNPSRFSEQVLPKYFKHSNLSSFVRQLNIYDFKKLSNDKCPDQYIYSHPYFTKNKPELMKRIHRKVNYLGNRDCQKDSEQQVSEPFSEQKSENLQKIKFNGQIQILEKKLKDVKERNALICQRNLQLQNSMLLKQSSNSYISKNLYNLLKQSYESQRYFFAQQIKNLCGEQFTLMNRLHQVQKPVYVNPVSNAHHFQRQLYDSRNQLNEINFSQKNQEAQTHEKGTRERNSREHRFFNIQRTNQEIDRNQKERLRKQKKHTKNVQIMTTTLSEEDQNYEEEEHAPERRKNIQVNRKIFKMAKPLDINEKNFSSDQQNDRDLNRFVVNLKLKSSTQDNTSDTPLKIYLPVKGSQLSLNQQND